MECSCSRLNVQFSIFNFQRLEEYLLQHSFLRFSGCSRKCVFEAADIFLFSIPFAGRSKAEEAFQRMGIVVFGRHRLPRFYAPSAVGVRAFAPHLILPEKSLEEQKANTTEHEMSF